MNERISSGTDVLDRLLSGGFEKDILTTVYGPAGSGKTCVCVLCSAAVARSVKKVIYIDTEGGFSVERLKQVANDYENLLKNMMFFKPLSFDEQKSVFDGLRKIIDDNIGLIVVDTIAMLYRLEIGKSDDVYGVNKELGQQLSYLTEIARRKNIPVLITNQVYADFENKDRVKMVGGDILKYSSKCLIELQNLHSGMRKALLIKHRSIPEGKCAIFKIVNKGISECENY